MINIILGNCLDGLKTVENNSMDTVFLDPPFNQGKSYRNWNDKMPKTEYFTFLYQVLELCYLKLKPGGSLFLMHREKYLTDLLQLIEKCHYCQKNIIIWKKLTSPVFQKTYLSKNYQPIIYATKGVETNVFNPLKIDPPLPANYKKERIGGIYLTDVWDDIRELTSGYFAKEEPLRTNEGQRFHLQQSPIALLLRIILMSTLPGGKVLDPFMGTGTSGVVSRQLKRKYIGIDIDPKNCKVAQKRIENIRSVDRIEKYRDYYKYTPNIDLIW